MTLDFIIAHFGYPAIFLGTLLEGELIMVIAGYFANTGPLNPFLVALTGFIGAFLSDEILFFIGYYQGNKILCRFPKPKVDKVGQWLKKYEIHYILSFRFIYGMRTVSPIFLGANKISPLKFITLNFLSAIVWSSLFTAVGYFFGQSFGHLIEEVEKEILIIILLGAFLIYVFKKIRRKEKPDDPSSTPC